LFAVGLAIFAGIVIDGLLWHDEVVVEPDAKTQKEQRAEDKLFGQSYTAAERESNFGKMGFGPDEIKKILEQVARMEEKYRVKDATANRVLIVIEASEDADELDAAFCGSSSTMPVRYAAMPFLLKEKDTRIKPIDLDEVSSLQYNEWARTARIQAAYDSADRTKDRKEDAVKMVMAAVMTRDEDELLERRGPFGGSFIGSGWSWDSVKKKYPYVEPLLFEYVALMHLVLENANREGGLCST
jgi:hypothetical protein